jgi:hypothetical protein
MAQKYRSEAAPVVAASCGSHYQKLPKNGTTIQRGIPPLCSAPLLSFQAIVMIIGVRTFHIILLHYTCKCRKNQFRQFSFAVAEVLEKRIAALIK